MIPRESRTRGRERRRRSRALQAPLQRLAVGSADDGRGAQMAGLVVKAKVGRGHALARLSDWRVRIADMGLFESRSVLDGERGRCCGGQRGVHGRERVGGGAQSGAWHLERVGDDDLSWPRRGRRRRRRHVRHGQGQDGDGARTRVATRSAVQGLLVKSDLQVCVERVEIDFELVLVVKVPVSWRRGQRAGRGDGRD